MKVLVTGWAWYIWSHTVVQLILSGYEVVIVDDLSAGKIEVIDRIEKITKKRPIFVQWDCGDSAVLSQIFKNHDIDGIIHFAAYKSVGESCNDPFAYYDNNIHGTIQLCKTALEYWVRNFIFSSSCTVYDMSRASSPFDETMPTWGTLNPYGTTKFVMEQIFRDLSNWKWLQGCMLRYFNPVGCHPSGFIGEDPSTPPTNLLPVIFQALTGQREKLLVFGNDYNTPDGTCLRDYIHVMDVADAHVLALQKLLDADIGPYTVINIWTWVPTSVQEMIHMVQDVTRKIVPYEVVERRNGDAMTVFGNTQLAKKILWRSAQYTVRDAVAHTWKFIQDKKL